MIRSRKEYQICCDQCQLESGWFASEERACMIVKSRGWEIQDVPGSPLKLFRCSTCVRLKRFPEGWNQE